MFQPDRLPDAGGRRVKDAFRFIDLLTPGLVTIVGGIPYRDQDLIFNARLHVLRDVQCKGIISPPVFTCEGTVQPDFRLPVGSFKMKEDPSAFPVRRDPEIAVVPGPVACSHFFPDSRKSLFNREGNQDFP